MDALERIINSNDLATLRARHGLNQGEVLAMVTEHSRQKGVLLREALAELVGRAMKKLMLDYRRWVRFTLLWLALFILARVIGVSVADRADDANVITLFVLGFFIAFALGVRRARRQEAGR